MSVSTSTPETRLFSYLEEDSYENRIMEVSTRDIIKKYNPYGYYFYSDEVSIEDLQQENGQWLADPDELTSTELREFLEEKFQLQENKDGWHILPTKEIAEAYCKFASLRLDYGEDYVDDYAELFEFNTKTGELTQVVWDESTECGEFYTYWDGSNHTELPLVSEHFDICYTEVTDEYPDWEKKILIAGSRGNTSAVEYYLLPETQMLAIYSISYWQGVLSDWTVKALGSEDFFEMIFLHSPDLSEFADKDLAAWTEKEFNQDGVKFDLTDNLLLARWKGEVYHLTEGESVEMLNNPSWQVSQIKDAIRTRKQEKLAEYYAEKVNELPLDRIYVSIKDSLASGNCQEETLKFATKMRELESASGDIAVRADVIIGQRDDSYTRRAVVKAYLSHYSNN